MPNLPELQPILDKWQTKLRLQDWEILIQYNAEEVSEGSMASVAPNAYHRRAVIYVHPSHKGLPEDDATLLSCIENSVIHELLHILLSPFCNDTEHQTVGRYIEEHIVGALSEAFSGYRSADKEWLELEKTCIEKGNQT